MSKLLPARKYRVFFLLICGTGLYFFANLQRVAIPGTVFDQLQGSLHASAPYITALGASFMYVSFVLGAGHIMPQGFRPAHSTLIQVE